MRLTNKFIALLIAAVFLGQAIGYQAAYQIATLSGVSWQLPVRLLVFIAAMTGLTVYLYHKSGGINSDNPTGTAITIALGSTVFASINALFTSIQTTAYLEVFQTKAFYAVFFAILIALVYSYLSVTQKGDKQG